MARLIWLHDESLSVPDWAQPHDQLVYIWDPVYLQNQAWSFKRWRFIYQCLCDLASNASVSLHILEGPAPKVLERYTPQFDDKLHLISPRDPILETYLHQVCAQLAPGVSFQWHTQPTWLTPPTVMPQGFFKFWKQVTSQL